MGNSASSSSGRGHHDDSVDYGHLSPQGVYTGPRDWNQAIVSQLICARRLAPFYRPLEEYEDSWDDDQILAARKELSDSEASESITRIEATASASASKSTHGKRPAMPRDPGKPEATVYRGAVECPICFLVRDYASCCFRPSHYVIYHSTTLPTSTTPDVATRLFALNVLFRSSGVNLQQPI